MLEERVTFPQRVGSARSGCGSSRVVSARTAGGRIGSARPSSDTRRPKLHTGRPSSAPPGHTAAPSHPPSWPAARLSGHTHSPHRTHDVTHLNLRVEGKSIRSVSYTPRRHQPVSRGSVRVVSSHAHPSTQARRRQFLSLHKASGYERHGEAAAAAAAAVAHTKGAARAAAAGFGSTYTVVCLDTEREECVAGPGHLGTTFTKEGPPACLGDRFGATYTLRSGRGLVQHSPSSSDSDQRVMATGKCDYDVCPQAPGEGGGYWGVDGDLPHPPATDTTSNEDSEGTVMSLGRRIQLMAAAGPPGSRHHYHHQEQQQQQQPWDAEWRTLLQQNHQLLLQLSSREDLRTTDDHPDTPRSASVQDSAVQTLPGTPSPELTCLSGSEAGEEPLPLDGDASLVSQSPECVLEDIAEESSLSDRSSPRTIVGRTVVMSAPSKDREPPVTTLTSSPGNTGMRQPSSASPRTHHTRVPSPRMQDTHTDTRKSLTGESIQFVSKSSVIEDTFQGTLKVSSILEEVNKQARKSSPIKEDDASRLTEAVAETEGYARKSPPLKEETLEHPQISPHLHEQIPEYLNHSSEEMEDMAEHQHSPSHDTPNDTSLETTAATGKQGSPLQPTNQPANPCYTDSSCTADLPSYRAGAVTTFIMRSRFSARDKIVATPRPQPSKDLLEALRMIEDEEKGATDKPERDTPTSTVPPALPSTHVPTRGPGGEREGSASLPVVEVLVEKVFLFTQDLVERWHLVEQHDRREELLRQLVEAERQLEAICVSEGCKQDPTTSPHLHQTCEGRLRRLKTETDARIQKNLDLIRKVMDDKKRLTEECERLEQRAKLADKRQADRAKAAEERHTQELKAVKERLAAAEQDRRERWTAQKTRSIRESVHRGLDTKLKEMSAKHRDEISLLKAQQWEALREAEEKHRTHLQTLEEEMKKRSEQEKEEACRREREREQQRLDMELRQSEQLSLARLEGVRRQQEKDLKALIEEHQSAMDKLRAEAEAGLREAHRERDRAREECQDKVRSLARKHEEELVALQQREERSRNEWKEQWMRQELEARQQAERELRERLKRQRDKEIERAIREIQAETAAREEEQRLAYDAKLKNMRERYESEMSEMECGERAARTRYLEMKALLAQKEEEIVYLRARLHTQDLELCDLQQMLQPPDG